MAISFRLGCLGRCIELSDHSFLPPVLFSWSTTEVISVVQQIWALGTEVTRRIRANSTKLDLFTCFQVFGVLL